MVSTDQTESEAPLSRELDEGEHKGCPKEPALKISYRGGSEWKTRLEQSLEKEQQLKMETLRSRRHGTENEKYCSIRERSPSTMAASAEDTRLL